MELQPHFVQRGLIGSGQALHKQALSAHTHSLIAAPVRHYIASATIYSSNTRDFWDAGGMFEEVSGDPGVATTSPGL